MVLKILLLLFALVFYQTTFGQIGAILENSISIYGTWKSNDSNVPLVMILKQDGTGSLNNDPIEFTFDQTHLTISVKGKDVKYAYSLTSNNLEVSGGDLNQKVKFSRENIQSAHTQESINSVNSEDSGMITIGTQIWTTNNLNVSSFRNGDKIMFARNSQEWRTATKEKIPAYCYYDFDPLYETEFGKLYNWYAVSDPCNLAPMGWHVPEIYEYQTLITFLGGIDLAGIRMKAGTGWDDIKTINGNGTNESKFSGKPAGRHASGFYGIHKSGNWWTASRSLEYNQSAWSLEVNSSGPFAVLQQWYKEVGLSVRCVKD